GLLAVPPILSHVARSGREEMLLICVLGLCFGASLLAVQIGYSEALGAFLIGAIMAESEHRHRIAHLLEPLRGLFGAVFFVAVGMLIDPSVLREYALPIAGIAAVVVVGKIVTCSLGTFVAGNSPRASLRVGMGLAQIGEFSFIIAALGSSLNVTSAFLYPIAVAVSAITTFLTPYLMRAADPLATRLSLLVPKPVAGALDAYVGWAAASS